MSLFKKLARKLQPNPLDTLLKKASRQRRNHFLICWNRGLGDIPLGLYALKERILGFCPQAELTFLTRPDLAEGLKMLGNVKILSDPRWKRGSVFELDQTFCALGIKRSDFDFVLEHPDPTYWLKWQLGTLVPKLQWNPEWDTLCESFDLDPNEKYLGVHVQTETNYDYEKNWPLEYWEEFFKKVSRKIILFGFAQTPRFEKVVDLRGKTTLFEMLSIIKNRCRSLVVPDSGILSMTYFLNSSFPMHIVSLWADPKQGVLKQNVESPNPFLCHRPLIAKNKDLRTVSVDSVLKEML